MNIENRTDKKILEFDKPVDPGKLMNELYEEIPELRPLVNDNGFVINMRMFTNGSKLILWVPDGVTDDNIKAVVLEHVALEEVGDN